MDGTPLHVTVTDCPDSIDVTGTGTTIVALSGALDYDAAPHLQSEFRGLLDRSVARIVVDLADLAFCDSIGLSTFVLAHRSCTAAGGSLRLAAPTPFLLRVLTVVGLLEAVPVYETVAQACSPDGQRLSAAAKAWVDR